MSWSDWCCCTTVVAMLAAAPDASTPWLEAPKCFSLLSRKPTTNCFFSAPSVLMIWRIAALYPDEPEAATTR